VKENQIRELEDFLLYNALAVNPDIINKKGKIAQNWGIRGVLRGGQGKPSKSSLLFRQLMGILAPQEALDWEAFGDESSARSRGEAGRSYTWSPWKGRETT
jgi:hypothetical protein